MAFIQGTTASIPEERSFRDTLYFFTKAGTPCTPRRALPTASGMRMVKTSLTIIFVGAKATSSSAVPPVTSALALTPAATGAAVVVQAAALGGAEAERRPG